MAISRRLRYEILRRDDHACRYCGQHAPDVPLTVDHVVPVALGGTDEATNLVTACKDCNAGKSSSAPDAPIVENVAYDALRWSRAMNRAAELQGAKRREAQEYTQRFDEKWCEWHTDYKGHREYIDRPPDWRNSIEQFHSLGLEIDVALDAVETAMNNKAVVSGRAWRYFCGICWRYLNERQELAREMLDAGAEE